MPLTRDQVINTEAFKPLSTLPDYKSSEEDSVMSGLNPVSAPTPVNIKSLTNPFFKSIDLETSEGIKLYNKATQGFATKDEDKFDMTQATIQRFKTETIKACANFNWGEILTKFKKPDGSEINIIKQNSSLTVQ